MNPTAAETLFRQLDTPLWLLTTAAGSRRSGLICTSVMSVSIVPDMPRIVVAIARQHETWSVLQEARHLALHLLSPESLSLVERFGARSSRDIDKFEGVQLVPHEHAAPILRESLGWLACSIEDRWSIGDRTVHLAAVDDAQPLPEGSVPLTTNSLARRASPELLEELKRQREMDAAVDVPLIQQWRTNRQSGL